MELTPPTALLVDMDDTLLDSHSASELAWGKVAGLLGSVVAREPAQVRAELAAANAWFWSDGARASGGRHDQAGARLTIAERACESLGVDPVLVPTDLGLRFLAWRLEHLSPFPGAIETLRQLRGEGVRLALVTNGEAGAQREKIAKFRLDQEVDTVLVEGELGFGKPDPRVFDLALERLGCTVRDVWIVGDDLQWEVVGGRRYGFASVWVNARDRELPADLELPPHHEVRSVAELPQLIEACRESSPTG